MNRYIHDGTAARASRASYEVIAASYIRRGVCVWGGGGLYAPRSTESWLGGMIMPITIHINCVTIFFKTWSFLVQKRELFSVALKNVRTHVNVSRWQH